MLLIVDNGSAFTKKIPEIIRCAGVDFELRRFDYTDMALDEYDSFILSGRRSNNKSMNALNARIIRHCVDESKKLLGICYGAELLALTLGGTIRRMNLLQRGSQTVTVTVSNPLVSGVVTVYESHMYELARLGPRLRTIAHSTTCQHEIIRYRDENIFGTQFHPEMSSDGAGILDAFLKL